MTTTEATQRLSEDWQEMIAWARTQEPQDRPSISKMKNEIGKSWFMGAGDFCDAFPDCKGCPILRIAGPCIDVVYMQPNKWLALHLAGTWEQWVDRAEAFLGQIYEARSVVTFREEMGLRI